MPVTDYPWYEVTDSTELELGDFINGCPIFRYPPEAAEKDWNGSLERASADVMIITQSCDLVVSARTGKPGVESVVVCPVFTRSELEAVNQPQFTNKDKWNLVIKEQIVGWRALEKCEITDFERELSAIDVRTFYTVPFAIIERLAGGKKRLRLRSPYRENISQAFGEQFTRVALPADIKRL